MAELTVCASLHIIQALGREVATVGLKFEWDPAKAASNRRKHGVSFPEAATVFGDPPSLTIPDPEHSETEDCFVTLGASQMSRRYTELPSR